MNSSIFISFEFPFPGNHSCLTMELTFSRDLNYFLVAKFFPDIVLVTCALLTFWMDLHASGYARILLTFLVFFNCFLGANFSFESGRMTALQSWHLITFVMVVSALFQYILVDYFGRRRSRAAKMRHRENLGFQVGFDP